jgi:hypothetical protein
VLPGILTKRFCKPIGKSENILWNRAMLKEIELAKENTAVIKFKEELDKAHFEEYEEAKYKPLTTIVKAYKNIYGVLPKGHPQKEFE